MLHDRKNSYKMENYQVLTLKYRPQTLDEIWIQEHIKITLKKAIENNRVAHAYLFTGPRGVGKTTTARILAKSLNCRNGITTNPCQKCSVCREITNSQNLDVLEIDGASNRGIDQVRELRENIKFLPTSCPYKIYIIDEVHMLTQEAFNALLKTLEEPPPHVKFIFATTSVQKVPSTILSRCQRFDFRKATTEEIVQRLSWVGEKEQIKITEDALLAISKRADGSIRDAEGMFDQLRVFKSDNIELKDVEDLLGIISSEIFFQYTEYVLKNDLGAIIEFIDKIFSTGYDLTEFFSGLLAHFRLLLMVQLNIKKTILGVSQHYLSRYAEQTERFKTNELLIIMQHIADAEEIVKSTSEPKILFEILTLNIVNVLSNNSSTTACRINKNQEHSFLWTDIISELSSKRPYFAIHLQNAVFKECENNILEITVETKSAKELLEAEKKEIEKIISQKLAKQVRISVTLTNEISGIQQMDTKKNVKPDTPIIVNHEKTENDTDKIFQEMFPKGRKVK